MLLTAALAGALFATPFVMLDTADAESGTILEVFRGRPGTGVRAEARAFAAETEGDLVIVKTVKRDGEIVSKEKERVPQDRARRARERDTDDDTAQATADDTAQTEETTLSEEAALSPEDSGLDAGEDSDLNASEDSDSLVTAANASAQEDRRAGGRRSRRLR
jgi:hypothetical protein